MAFDAIDDLISQLNGHWLLVGININKPRLYIYTLRRWGDEDYADRGKRKPLVVEKSSAHSNDDVVFTEAMKLASTSIVPMALRAAVELGLFEIIAASGKEFLTPTKIASKISTQNKDAPAMVERILRFLASSSVLKCEVIKKPDGERLLYGLRPVCKYFLRDKDGVSLGDYLLLLEDKVSMETGYYIKDAVVDGVNPFMKAYGMLGYEYSDKDLRCSEVFHKAMYSVTTATMNKILKVYKGFEGITQVVDVGGGTGANLAAVVSRYPNIKGINFDLPHVVKQAPPSQGVKHVDGDMFESVPGGEVIFLKDVLHNWGDEHCLKLLKNCWKALPRSGKVIVVDALVPQYPHTDDISNTLFRYDLIMLRAGSGAKERTEIEFDNLAKEAGFVGSKVICNVHIKCVIEFYKK